MYPVLYGVWISLFNKHSFFPEQTFIGLGNYVAILGDAEFWASVQRGAIYAVSTIVLQIVLGVAVAVLLDQRFPGRNILRAIVIFPVHRPHGRGRDFLEVASQQPVRVGQLSD